MITGSVTIHFFASRHVPCPTEFRAIHDLPVPEILYRAAKANGSTRYCMGAAWREVKDDANFDAVLDMVRGVSDMDYGGLRHPRHAERPGHAGGRRCR